ncbi:hypothetical protein [Microcoleus sp. FACHB-672]|uniref:hypothetical protein n=1 Tax=Microcoleus sp. FACHB-672 TaxID=2692825 RepID=UPI001682B0B0|nr:hypothetical protein [Microcoleus sp. FACHB-672]MBD2041019.1 hypothetical protein [Microcoleus sp. FACHB-672]
MTLNASQNPSKITFLDLWRQFIPLSLSDVAMACGDPMMTTTLAHLPDTRVNLAALGIAKSLAIFFESPIITILHASNALAPMERSRRALWRFTLLAGGGLSALLLLLLTLPFVFATLGGTLLGIPSQLQQTVRIVLTLMILWPFAIAWRRYFQGLLIHTGHSQAVAIASIARLVIVALVLLAGFTLKVAGAVLAGTALIAGVVVEAVIVTWAAQWLGATRPPRPTDSEPNLPTNLKSVWKFYWPLACSMLVLWGGRAVLVGIIARAQDADIALAAWPAAWGLVLVIANATRMVQQVIIKNRGLVTDRQLIAFALSVGMLCSLLLLLSSTTPFGLIVVQSFVGNDSALVEGIRPVLLLCAVVPLLVAAQNATQGFLVGSGQTRGVNRATWMGTTILLLGAFLGVQLGVPGAIAAATAMIIALISEVSCLAFNFSKQSSSVS